MNTRSLIAGVVSFLSSLSAADFSGKYKGAFESSSGGRLEVSATLRQQGERLTGSIGPSPAQQAPIEDATIESGCLSFRIGVFGNLRLTFPDSSETLVGTIARVDGKPPAFDRVTLRRVGALTLADTMPLLPNEGPSRSMRILQLRQNIERDPRAIDEFWTSVKKTGAPLVEPDPSDNRFQYATFLWEGKPEHKNVLVMWMPFATARPADWLMTNLPGTALWFRTVRLPRGARLEYRLSPNDPLGSIPPLGLRNAVRDPLNPKGSLLEAPGAASQPYYEQRLDVPKMTKYEHTLASDRLKQDRKFIVYTPPGYDPKAKPYPSIYLFDGEDRDGLVFASWTFENLIASKKIPAMVVVRIVNPGQSARMRLACEDDFFDFLSKELVPFVRSSYNVSRNPGETGISGYSLGGLAASYAGFRHSEIFGLILSQSGSYWYEPTRDETAEPTWFAQKFIASPKLPLRFYLEAGMFEVDLSGRGSSILIPNRHFRDVLRAKEYDVTYHEFPGGHDYINWRGTLADGLVALFGPVH